jgi:osmotically-inducible protein OsmY
MVFTKLKRRLKMRKHKPVCALTVAFIVPGLFVGCAAERKCGFEGCPGDAQISTNVESLLNQHPEIGTEVNVQTLNHVVYLSGFVAAGEIRATAENVAGTAPGVSKVVDTIAVTR